MVVTWVLSSSLGILVQKWVTMGKMVTQAYAQKPCETGQQSDCPQ